MLPTFLYLQLLVAHPAPVIAFAIPRSDVQFDVTFKELDAVQVAGLVGDALPAAFRDRFRGRIGRVVLSMNGDLVTVKADGFRMPGDWMSRAEGTMDLKTREYKAKLWAFGGLVEFSGTMPTEDEIARTRTKGKGTAQTVRADR